MNDSMQVVILTSLISLAGIWILYFWLYISYRVDSFRDELFSLRDELFDIARDGHIDYNHAAYGMLRSHINTAVKKGHKVSFTHFLVSKIFSYNDKAKAAYMESYNERWESAIDELDIETRNKLLEIRRRVITAILFQLVLTSSFLFFTTLSFIIILIFKKMGENTYLLLHKWFGDDVVNDVSDNLAFQTLVGGYED